MRSRRVLNDDTSFEEGHVPERTRPRRSQEALVLQPSCAALRVDRGEGVGVVTS
jgi:hypothetical protein